jgi:hypothetical protein
MVIIKKFEFHSDILKIWFLHIVNTLIHLILFVKVYRQFRVGLDFDITMSIKPRNITGLLLGIQGRRDYLLLQVNI